MLRSRTLSLANCLSYIAFTASLVLGSPQSVEACGIDPLMVFPTCDIPAPRPDERVTTIYAARGQALSSVTVGGDAMLTEVVEVEVDAAEKPHYIALSSGGPIVWRFTGQTASISRLVVFGSQYLGYEKTGVVGVPKERVLFISADVGALKSAPQTSCHANVAACELATYFNIPRLTNRMQLGPVAHWNTRPEQAAKITEDKRKFAESLHMPLELASNAFPTRDELNAGPFLPDLFPADQHVRHWRPGRVRVPADGNLDAGQTTYLSPYDLNVSHEGGLVQIDPADVLSPSQVTTYEVLPTWAGIKQLLASGALLAPSAPEFKAIYHAWDEEISKRYQSELDPDFHFNYPVDYLVAKPTGLPAALPNIYLVAPEISSPKMNDYSSCIFLADQDKAEWPKGQRDPRCDNHFILSGLNLMQSARGYKGLWRETALVSHLTRLEEISHASPEARKNCRAASIPDDVYFVGISANETRLGAKMKGRRRADVTVNRPGKVALYLEYWGKPVDWHITGSSETEIVTILISKRWGHLGLGEDRIVGLENPPAIQDTFSRQREDACRVFGYSGPASYGGPAALAVNESLKVLAGRGLDHLYKQTNDGSWPAPTPDGQTPVVRFAVE